MAALRDLLDTPTGRATGVGFVLIALVVVVVCVWRSIGKSEAADMSQDRVFMDSETGKTFSYKLKVGDMTPVKSPYTGRETGYETERCYWTKDGKPKKDPTYVLLNSAVGKPEPTFCPDCGRLVLPLNPPASKDSPAPPTKEEYLKNPKRQNKNTQQD